MIQVPLAPFYVWSLVFIRAGFIMGFFPIIGERFVPLRIRVLTAAVLAIAITPVVPFNASAFPSDPLAFVLLVLTEALLGFGIGMIGRILFGVIQFAGQMAGEQMGFGLVNAIDPTGSHQISVVAEMQYVLSILVFLSADLHHGFIHVIGASYEALPPGGASATPGVAEFMMGLGSVLFSFSLQLAMPIILIVFAINVGLGMIARGVPQINVFLESFPLRIIAGVAVLMLSLGFTMGLWLNMAEGIDGWMSDLIGRMRG